MGYRSDVLVAIAFDDKKQRDEVWAVYCMNPLVQKHNLAGMWKNHDDEAVGVFCLWHEEIGTKWYESYEDVRGIEHMRSAAEQFADNRDTQYAWVKYRIGEDSADIEEEIIDNDDEGHLRDYLWDMCGIRRELINAFN